MLVNKVFETEQGTAKFEGELEGEELDLVIKVGLNFLLQAGALPVITSMENMGPTTPQEQ